jgi:hypothetical protein
MWARARVQIPWSQKGAFLRLSILKMKEFKDIT